VRLGRKSPSREVLDLGCDQIALPETRVDALSPDAEALFARHSVELLAQALNER